IAVGLDLHGLVTRRMLTHADILTACKHNPHSDYVEAGATAARLAVAKHRGTQRPVTVACHLPMLLAGNMDTSSGPLQAAHRLARERSSKHPGLLDISIFNVIPLLDAPEMGQVVLAITDDEPEVGIEAAREIAELLWRRRSEFRDDFPSINAVLDRVVSDRAQRPFVLADFGDRVLAGAPGDSTDILASLLLRGEVLKVVLPVTDPQSVARAQAAGLGAKVELSVGGCYTAITPPVTVTGTVRHLSDGRFVMKGPFLAGQEASMGDTAVVAVGPLTLLLTAGSALTQDVNCFESQGIRISEQDIIVTKSGYHFELSFAGIATPLKVETKGLGVYRPGRFPVTRSPLYPEVDPGAIAIEPAVIA
ncbi:MAG TPA: M81 family peptidase, partial [Kiloniellaceae bacterium]|nr:M81 family peptidase [Kiloniellaceae bacterium]